MAAARLVYPAPGATGVVQNPGLLVAIERASLHPAPPRRAPPDPPALGEGLLLRDDAGRIIAAGPLLTIETPRPIGATRAAADSRVEIATSPLELEPDTHYEVLSRAAVCAGDDGVRVACLQEEYVAIGDFTTGTELDRTPPVITSVEVAPSPGACLVALNVVASDDHAEPDALRFQSSGLAWLGPRLVVPAPEADDGESRVALSLVALDPSGNRGLTLVVDVDGCPRPDDLEDDYLSDAFEPVAPAPTPPVHRRSDSSCAFVAGPTGAASGAGLLALAVALVARRRASVTARTARSRARAPS